MMHELALFVGRFSYWILGFFFWFAIRQEVIGLLARYRPIHDRPKMLESSARLADLIGGLGPMAGFMGTVVALIAAMGRLDAGEGLDLAALASDIAFALGTTLIGLVIGMIASHAEVLIRDAMARTSRASEQT